MFKIFSLNWAKAFKTWQSKNMEGKDEEDEDIILEQEVVSLVSSLYLILVGITGATFNVRALTKAKRVGIFFAIEL